MVTKEKTVTEDVAVKKAENQKLRAMLADYLLREKLYG